MKILERPADDYQIFGDFVAAELRSLKSSEKQRLLKQKIQRVILDISESEDVPSVLSWNIQPSSSPSSTATYYSNFNNNSPVEVVGATYNYVDILHISHYLL